MVVKGLEVRREKDITVQLKLSCQERLHMIRGSTDFIPAKFNFPGSRKVKQREGGYYNHRKSLVVCQLKEMMSDWTSGSQRSVRCQDERKEQIWSERDFAFFI